MKWTPDASVVITQEARQFAERQEARDRVRAERNRRLAESDWTMLEDAPADKAGWTLYRRALRELDMTNPVWPEPPGDDMPGGERKRFERPGEVRVEQAGR